MKVYMKQTRFQVLKFCSLNLFSSYDLVFSNWLLMYLEEHEVQELFCKVLKWLRPGGYFFFRESCFHPSGELSRLSHSPCAQHEMKDIDYSIITGASL